MLAQAQNLLKGIDWSQNNGNANNNNNNNNNATNNNGSTTNNGSANVNNGAHNSAVKGNGANVVLNSAVKNVKGNAQNTKAAALPQTGNNNASAVVALGAVSAMFGLGLAAKKREF